LRILVAETDLPLLVEMKHSLEQAGHDVVVACGGMAAWDYLTGATPPDLLVTRLRFKPGEPPGTALGLYAANQRPRLPVVYIPASLDLAEHADPEHGTVLVKPFAMAELVEAVTQLLAAGGSAFGPAMRQNGA
jgi:DNA-binding response OmpR family regulator